MATSARAAAKKIALAERQQTALSLRKSGATYRAIAAHIALLPGNERYSEGLAHADIAACLKTINTQTSLDTEEYRALELERLDTAQLAIAPKVQAGDLLAIDRWLRISERRSALLGLDAPIQLKVEQQLQIELNRVLDNLESALPVHLFDQVLGVLAGSVPGRKDTV